MIKKIATGSLRNKLLIILPAALILSEFVPILVEIILMFGGAYLAFEGAEKIHHRLSGHADEAGETAALPETASGPELEEKTVKSAVRTDFILSAEIMVIALNEVAQEPLVSRAIILAVVAVMITALVYGVVAIIVKMDDIGLHLAERESQGAQQVGRLLVRGMPKVLAFLSTLGIVAMLWVGGHILLVGTDELGWHGLYDVVHHLEVLVRDATGALGGALGWLTNTLASAAIGVVVGAVVVAVIMGVSRIRANDDSTTPAAH